VEIQPKKYKQNKRSAQISTVTLFLVVLFHIYIYTFR